MEWEEHLPGKGHLLVYRSGFHTDAASEVGYGGFLAGEWFACTWCGKQRDWSMPCMELFPILIAVTLWGDRWRGKRILVYCDSDSTVKALNKGYTNKEPAATMLRCIVRLAMQHNFLVKAAHIPGKKNVLADMLSRQRIEEFLRACPYASDSPCVIPEELINFCS